MVKGLTNRQLVFILIIILISNSMYAPRLIAEHAGRNGWITLVIASVIFASAAAVIIKLNSLFEGKTLADYGREVLGGFFGSILNMLLVVYFMATTVYLLVTYSGTLSNNFLVKTPTWFIIITGVPFYGYTAYKGITNIGRLGEIIGIVVIFASVFVRIIMLFEGDIGHILPLYTPSELGRSVLAVSKSTNLFLGIEFLTVIPFAGPNSKKTIKTAFLTTFVIGLWIIFIAISSIMMVGMNEIINYTDPTVISFRLVEVPFLEILARVDILYLTFKLSGFCVSICLSYCVLVEYASRILPKVSRKAIVIAAGAAICALAIFISGINDVHDKSIVYIYYITPIVSILIPATLLAVARIRKIGRWGLQ